VIRYQRGDILAADVDALVNPVNCVGVMGAGLAKQFKKAYPVNFERYRVACMQGEVMMGRVFVTMVPEGSRVRYIVNFPTKQHWLDNSRLEDIAVGLRHLADWITGSSIDSIALPALGCGLGGLRWETVRPMIVKYLGNIAGVDILVYAP
jgi:O-acetyl-ADP-ribose deacetylase (regulator of RNase III)